MTDLSENKSLASPESEFRVSSIHMLAKYIHARSIIINI